MPSRNNTLPFESKLVLHQWMLSLFEVNDLNALADMLRDPSLEGFDAENISHYCHVLRARLFDRKELPGDLLLAYDQNIVRHWKRITEKRNRQGHLLYPNTSNTRLYYLLKSISTGISVTLKSFFQI